MAEKKVCKHGVDTSQFSSLACYNCVLELLSTATAKIGRLRARVKDLADGARIQMARAERAEAENAKLRERVGELEKNCEICDKPEPEVGTFWICGPCWNDLVKRKREAEAERNCAVNIKETFAEKDKRIAELEAAIRGALPVIGKAEAVINKTASGIAFYIETSPSDVEMVLKCNELQIAAGALSALSRVFRGLSGKNE